MWLPPKVRHLVLVNQSPLPSSSPPLLPLLPPLSFLPIYFLYCLFLERNLRVPGITLNWKQTHSSHQKPRNQRHVSGFVWGERVREREGGKKKNTSGFSLWKNAYLNCGRIRLKALLGREVRVLWRGGRGWFCWRRCGEWKWEKRASPSAQMLLLLLSMQLYGSFSPPEPRSFSTLALLFTRVVCVTIVNRMHAAMVQKYSAADRCLLKSSVSSCLECGSVCSIFNSLSKQKLLLFWKDKSLIA